MLLNGQTIKTKCITKELIKYYGENQILTMDSHRGVKVVPRIRV